MRLDTLLSTPGASVAGAFAHNKDTTHTPITTSSTFRVFFGGLMLACLLLFCLAKCPKKESTLSLSLFVFFSLFRQHDRMSTTSLRRVLVQATRQVSTAYALEEEEGGGGGGGVAVNLYRVYVCLLGCCFEFVVVVCVVYFAQLCLCLSLCG